MTGIRLYAALAAVLAVFGIGYYIGTLPGKAALARLQDATDKATIVRQQASDKAIADMTSQRDIALKANEVTSNEFQAKLDSQSNLASDLARRLRNAESRAITLSTALSKASDKPALDATTAPSGMGQITDATAGALAECQTVRSQLEALQSELAPQLR